MNDTMRLVLGVIAGAVVAILCVIALEMLGHALYPPPPGTDISDPEQMKALMANVPAAALAIVAAASFLGSLIGALVANRIAKRPLAGWIVALLMIAGSVYTLVIIPHPLWLQVCAVLLPLLGAWLAQRMTKVP